MKRRSIAPHATRRIWALDKGRFRNFYQYNCKKNDIYTNRTGIMTISGKQAENLRQIIYIHRFSGLIIPNHLVLFSMYFGRCKSTKHAIARIFICDKCHLAFEQLF